MISMMLDRMNKMVGNVLDGLLTLKDFPGKPPHQKGPSMLKIFSLPPAPGVQRQIEDDESSRKMPN